MNSEHKAQVWADTIMTVLVFGTVFFLALVAMAGGIKRLFGVL